MHPSVVHTARFHAAPSGHTLVAFTLRLMVVLWALMMLAAPAMAAGGKVSLTAQDQQTYRRAFDAVKANEWQQALSLTRQGRQPRLNDVIRWTWYQQTGSGASFQEIATFLRTHSHWPRQERLQARAEEAITAATPARQIIAFYQSGNRQPVTGDGVLALATALSRAGQKQQAVQVARRGWIEEDFGPSQQSTMLSRFGGALRPQDHVARIDRLLWEDKSGSARRMYPLVPSGWRALAEARRKLHDGTGDAWSVAAKVPASLRNNPGLIYEKARRLRHDDRDREAINLVLAHPGDKGDASAWAYERTRLARVALDQNQPALAYRVAANHGPQSGGDLIDTEGMAGFIALRYLNDPKRAYGHFQNVQRAVTHPRRQAYAGYWMGRSAEAMGDKNNARRWYQWAARFPAFYYGQLAMERLHGHGNWRLPGDPTISGQDRANFVNNDLVQAASLLYLMNESDRVGPFIMQLHDVARSPGEHLLTTQMAQRMGRYDLTVHGAMKAQRQQVPITQAAYPVPRLPFAGGVEQPLVLGLVRQESAFNAQAGSHVGAQGLMQLMPATARGVSGWIGESYSKARLTRDPAYNMRLGTAYLAKMLKDFNGSIPMALAAYNAGPGRVRQWERQFGNPSTRRLDGVDWVERIPYEETRHYVQRVLEGTQIYRMRLGGGRGSSLTRDLNG